MSTGFRITTLQHLVRVMEHRGSVVCPSLFCWSKPRPAAFILQLPGRVIHRLLHAGLFFYDRPRPAKPKTP